jgi:TRAP-type C4-dicarboxylate transport system permease small subunit
MRKRPPYLEIAVTLAVIAFLGLIILGGFDQGANNGGRVTLQSN